MLPTVIDVELVDKNREFHCSVFLSFLHFFRSRAKIIPKNSQHAEFPSMIRSSRGCSGTFMHEDAIWQHRRDYTYTVPYVPADSICANARPRTLAGRRIARCAMRDLNRRLGGRTSGFAWPAAKSPLQPCGLSPPAKTRMPHTRHTNFHE